MSDTYDLRPAGQRMVDLLHGLSDERLAVTTPCGGISVGDLVDHISAASTAFTQAARKERGAATGPPPPPDARRLPPDWKSDICERVETMSRAWESPDAWEGVTPAGGRDLPGAVVGRVALDELVVHAWDIARATGARYLPDDASVAGAMEFVSGIRASEGDGAQEGLFGAVVPVSGDAPPLDRLLGVTGRDPNWQPRE